MANIIFETTRRCQLSCDHCLRGKAQNKNLPKEYVTSILEALKNEDESYDVTFSGGEPTLNLPVIEFFIDEVIRLEHYPTIFYIATNGLELDAAFAIACLRLYALCEEKDLCAVQLSNDAEHEYIPEDALSFMQGLSFFSKKHAGNPSYYRDLNPLCEGNAKLNGLGHRSPYKTPKDSEISEYEFYVNCNGWVINGCSWSYSNQNRADLKLCKVEDFQTLLQKLKGNYHG